jgi:membrane protease YdiL (CAAX protease family)
LTSFRLLLTLLVTVVAVTLVAQGTRRRGLLPSLLQQPAPGSAPRTAGGAGEVLARQTLAALILGVALLVSVAAPIGAFGLEVSPDLNDLSYPQLFTLHALFACTLLALYAVGYLPDVRRSTSLWSQYGFRARAIGRELLLGAGAGLAIWFAVIALLLILQVVVTVFEGSQSLPQEPPPMVLWMAGLPVVVRVAVSLSAGFFAETFFRGLLQPRVGVPLSTVFFALAHLSYNQPFMLVGVTLLSVFFSFLLVWRQSIWAAIAAHSTFDLIQLLVVIPLVSRVLQDEQALSAL